MKRRIALVLAFILLNIGAHVYAAEPDTAGPGTEGTEEEPGSEMDTDPAGKSGPEANETEGTEEEPVPEADPAEKADEEPAPESHEIIVQVAMPADSKACLDPGNLSGRGQIFSDSYRVENHGNTDIVIQIKNIDVYYLASEDVYELSREEVTDGPPTVKRLHVDMIWKNENEDTEKILNISEGVADQEVLCLKAAEYDENGEFVRISDGGAGFFRFTGTVNPDPRLVWEDGEITVRFNYELIPVESEKTAEEGEREKDTEEKTDIPEAVRIPAEDSLLGKEEPAVDVKDTSDGKYTEEMTDKENPGNMDGPEPADGGGSGENTEGTDHTDEAESADDGEPGENAENMDSTEYTDETGSADNGEVTDDTADTDGEKQAEDTESAGDPEYTDHLDYTENGTEEAGGLGLQKREDTGTSEDGQETADDERETEKSDTEQDPAA